MEMWHPCLIIVYYYGLQEKKKSGKYHGVMKETILHMTGKKKKKDAW